MPMAGPSVVEAAARLQALRRRRLLGAQARPVPSEAEGAPSSGQGAGPPVAPRQARWRREESVGASPRVGRAGQRREGGGARRAATRRVAEGRRLRRGVQGVKRGRANQRPCGRGGRAAAVGAVVSAGTFTAGSAAARLRARRVAARRVGAAGEDGAPQLLLVVESGRVVSAGWGEVRRPREAATV